MNVRRSWIVFLLMLVTVACILLLVAQRPIMESFQALRGTPEDCDWQCVGMSAGSTAAAAGWQDGALVLRYFTTDGARLSLQRVELPDECAGGTVARLLPVRDGLAYLGIYGPDAKRLYLFRVQSGGAAERLLAVNCVGASCEERSARTKLTELDLEDGVLSFALWTDDLLELYACREDEGLSSIGNGRVADARVRSILVNRDGSLLQGGVELLNLNGNSSDALVSGHILTHWGPGKGGCFFLDGTTLELCYVTGTMESLYRVLTVDTRWDGKQRSLTSVVPTRDDRVLGLLDNSVLIISEPAGTRELTGILRPAVTGQWLSLAKYAGIALAVAALLWLVLCGLRRGYASLVVLRGSVIVACAALCLTALGFAVIGPAARASTLRESSAVIAAVLRASGAEQRWNDEALVTDTARMLDAAMVGGNAQVVRADLSDGVWRLADGQSALTRSGFSPTLADAALAGGTAAELRNHEIRYVLTSGTHSLSVSMDIQSIEGNPMLFRLVSALVALLALLALVVLATVSGDIRKITKQMETISRGSIPEQMLLRTGDELESMASTVNSMAASIVAQDEKRNSLEHSYRRFVPEEVLALLGKHSILEIDKSAFVVRHMAIMAVGFTFPETLYTDLSNSRLLFDSINEVIERSSAIVARKGGTIHHFDYFGFDAVMDDGSAAVSTAVAILQEMLSFNEQRAQGKLPGVTMHIALDKGDVMFGIVGDTARMSPTTVSTSINTAMELTQLCGRLNAGILCTESIISEHPEHPSRYVGKCIIGGKPVRAYEVFDGDEFNTRRGKANSMEAFSKGVYDLYAGETTLAKHTFLQLAHNYPLDGGARYYLHLADQLEHDPTLPCVLNAESVVGRRV